MTDQVGKGICTAIFLAMIAVGVVAYELINKPPTLQKAFDPTTDQDFSIIVLPDTQMYAEFNPEFFCAQTQWIVDHKDLLNIVFVQNTGDIVNNGAADLKQWQVASDCFAKLEGQVPFGIVPGNHDVDKIGDRNATFKAYNQTFPLSRFYLYPWYRGDYLENQNNYQVIHAGGEDLLFLNLEVDPPDDVLEWANKVLQDNQDKRVIVTTHVFLNDKSGQRADKVHFRTGNNTAEDIWQKIIAQNCNVFMVWSGHFHDADGENQLASTNNCGRPVHQIVQDYQARDKGGEGRLRIYTFSPEQKIIDVQSYSPVTDTFEVDADSQFTLSY